MRSGKSKISHFVDAFVAVIVAAVAVVIAVATIVVESVSHVMRLVYLIPELVHYQFKTYLTQISYSSSLK